MKIPVFEPVIEQDEIDSVVAALQRGEISGTFGEALKEFEKDLLTTAALNMELPLQMEQLLFMLLLRRLAFKLGMKYSSAPPRILPQR